MTQRIEVLEAHVARLEQRLRRQQRRSALALVIVGGALAMATLQPQTARQRITELDVERLNVVEPDGQPVLTMANAARLPDPLIGGKTLDTGRNGPGIIFFDGKGWEVGGLVYSTRANGGATGHLSFDQFHNDQVVYLQYDDNGSTNKRAGLFVTDRARTPTLDELVRLRGEQASASPERRAAIDASFEACPHSVFSSAPRTKPRCCASRIAKAAIGSAWPSIRRGGRLEFLDASGRVVGSLPK